MACEQIRELLGGYVDDELAVDERRRVEEHLRECSACNALATEQRAVRSFVHRRVAITPTPAHTRARVIRVLEIEAESERPVRWAGWHERFAARWTQPRYRLALAAAAAALLLISLAPLLRGPQTIRLEEVARHYDAIARGEPELSFRTHDIDALRDYFRRTGQFDFDDTVPNLSAAGLQLIGGRVSRVGSHVATLSVYDSKHGRVLCHRFRADRFRLPAGGELVSSTLLYEVDGVSIRVIQEGNVVCLLASSLPPERLAHLLAPH